MSDVDFGGSGAVPYFGEDGRAEATAKARAEEGKSEPEPAEPQVENVDPDGKAPEEQEHPSAGKDSGAEEAAEASEDAAEDDEGAAVAFDPDEDDEDGE